MKKAVFLDLNGTLVEPVRVEKLSELTLIAGVIEAVAKLNEAGFICPVITVQSRIAKGYFSKADFLTWFDAFARQAKSQKAILLGPYICPHPYAETCICQKPNPYLYEKAARDYAIDVSQSLVIGDTASDIEAGLAIGAQSCLVKTGWGYHQSNLDRANTIGAHTADNLPEAVAWFLARASS